MSEFSVFNPVLSDLIEVDLQGLSPIQTIMKMAEKQEIISMGLRPEEVISFGGGWCNHASPSSLQETYKEILHDDSLFHQSGRYSPIKGDFDCLSQLCAFEKKVYGISDLTADNILIGHSSTQLMHDILRVIQNPGDGVCVLDPTYANYENTIKCAIPCSSVSFVPALDPVSWTYLPDQQHSLDVLQDACEKGARSCILSVPDNPTSQIPSDVFISEAQKIMKDHDGFLILDFAYKALWFDDMPPCFSWSPNQMENVIMVHSHSKWLSSLGRRFGWIEAHPSIVQGMEKVAESTLLSPDTLHSMVTTRFLEKGLGDQYVTSFIDTIRKLYRDTAKVLIDCIEEYLGWKYLYPKGGLYTVCPTPNNEEPFSFVGRVLKNTGVLFIPGLGFGPSMEKAIRISYGPLCNDHDVIEKGIKKVQKYLYP